MSKKKTLLEEGTVRRFMKLANMEAIGSNFVNETYAMADDDKPMEEEAMPPMQDDEMEAPEGDEEMLDVDLEADEEMPEAPEGEEMDMDAEDMGELTLTDEEAEVFLKVADKVRAAMDSAEPAEELPAPDMGGDEMDMEMDAEMDVEAAPEDEEPEDEPMMENMVNEVARRVARRIQKMKKSK
jgi:hypothetical protein